MRQKLQLKIDSMLPHNIMDHQHPLRYYDDHHQNYTHHLQFKNPACIPELILPWVLKVRMSYHYHKAGMLDGQIIWACQ
jgi:hypothetical protein